MRVLTRLLPAALLGSTLMLSACQSSEDKAEGHYQAALDLIAERDYDRAIVELRNVFQNDGFHREARYRFAELMLNHRGNRQEAYSQYLRLAEQYPDDLEARIALTELAFGSNLWDEVERHGSKAEELAPEDPRVEAIAVMRSYRAAILAQNGAGRSEAARRADALLSEQPDNFLLRNVMIDNALRESDLPRALAEIDKVIAQQPDDPRYYQERLRVLGGLGDMGAIEAQLRQMIERFPDDVNNKAMLVRFYLSQQDADGAEAFLRELASASAPEDSGPTVDLIRFLAEVRGAEAARAEIDKAIAERPDPVPFQVLGAGLDFAAGKRDGAIATLEEVLKGAEPSEQTRNIKVALARMLLTTGNEVGARTRVEEVLAEEATHPEALKMRAAWLIEADDTDTAIAALRTALDRTPEDAQAMSLMAEAYSRSGRAELSRDFLALAVEASGNAPAETIRYARVLIGGESYLSAEDILIKALRSTPDNPDLLVVLGELYLRMEDFPRAQQVADTLRRLDDPAALQAANGLDAERINRQSGTEEAMAFLEQLASSADATLASRIALIRARMATGDTAGALEQAQVLKQENPGNEALDFVLATAHAVNGDLAGAEAIYRDLVATNPARPGVWLEISRVQQRQGDRAGAMAAIDEGLGHTPGDGQLLWARASFLEQDGEIDGAIAIYEDLYERNSSSLVIANNLASLLATYRQDEASLERAWTIARRLRDAEVPAVQDTYGWIAHRRGESAEALPYLEAAARGLPGDALVQYHLAQAYLALGRQDEALDQFRKAVEIAGPGDSRAQIEEARRQMHALQASGSASEN
ncbi:tetratricopeptide repeat protein [Rhodovulum steppense]|uniref:Tetratricopeptide repeat protein n=1 Tax=Rhodovulum steppense TaxID=540251 RepID=A0A4R1YMS8_9RHOB|nr:tetratricopeptide repeat protein [Rhodovulum steppense]TCM78982.1 tetratricopeptide repeat protein [Rhodovulum steppense]